MKRKYSTERVKAQRTLAVASQFICHISDLKPGTLVVLFGRESTSEQKNNLPDQMAKLKSEADKHGLRVVDDFAGIAPGDSDFQIRFGRAVLIAKEAGAAILAESVDRYRRLFDEFDRDGKRLKLRKPVPLNVFELNKLLDEADGVQLATSLHPDATPDEVRRYQTKRGQAGKGNYGGRPIIKFPKKARREALMPKAIQLREAGLGYGKIAGKLKVARSTIRDWIKQSEH